MTTLKAIVQTASTTPAANCWGRYKRVAVIVVDLEALREIGREIGHEFPAMISTRARGVVRIVETWENQNVGTTKRCAYWRAVAEAEELAARINDQIEKGQWS